MGSLDADTVGLLAASEGQPLALALQALAATGTLPAVMDTTIDNDADERLRAMSALKGLTVADYRALAALLTRWLDAATAAQAAANRNAHNHIPIHSSSASASARAGAAAGNSDVGVLPSPFWGSLADAQVSVPALVSLLYLTFHSSAVPGEAVFVACECYCLLLRLPGNSGVLQPMHLRVALFRLRVWAQEACDAATSVGKRRGKAAQTFLDGESNKAAAATAAAVKSSEDAAAARAQRASKRGGKSAAGDDDDDENSSSSASASATAGAAAEEHDEEEEEANPFAAAEAEERAAASASKTWLREPAVAASACACMISIAALVTPPRQSHAKQSKPAKKASRSAKGSKSKGSIKPKQEDMKDDDNDDSDESDHAASDDEDVLGENDNDDDHNDGTGGAVAQGHWVSLSGVPETLPNLAETLAEVARVSAAADALPSPPHRPAHFARAAAAALAALRSLAALDRHAPGAQGLAVCLKALLPNVLLSYLELAPVVPKFALAARDQAIALITTFAALSAADRARQRARMQEALDERGAAVLRARDALEMAIAHDEEDADDRARSRNRGRGRNNRNAAADSDNDDDNAEGRQQRQQPESARVRDARAELAQAEEALAALASLTLQFDEAKEADAEAAVALAKAVSLQTAAAASAPNPAEAAAAADAAAAAAAANANGDGNAAVKNEPGNVDADDQQQQLLRATGAANAGVLGPDGLPLWGAAGDSARARRREAVAEWRAIVGVTVHQSMATFLQHVCGRSRDKANLRQLAAAALAVLLTAFPSALSSVTRFVKLMARHKRLILRNQAVEMALAMLTCPDLLGNKQHNGDGDTSAAATGSRSKRAAAKGKGKAKGSKDLDDFVVNSDDDDDNEEVDESRVIQKNSRKRANVLSNDGDDDSDESNNDHLILPIQDLLTVLLDRASDRAPGVRARALSHLAECIRMCADPANDTLRRQFHSIFNCVGAAAGEGDADPDVDLDRTMHNANNNMSNNGSPMSPGGVTPAKARSYSSASTSAHGPGNNEDEEGGVVSQAQVFHSPLPTTPAQAARMRKLNGSAAAAPGSPFHPRSRGVQKLLRVLRRRAADPKSNVRRAAIQAMEALLLGADDTRDDRHNHSLTGRFAQSPSLLSGPLSARKPFAALQFLSADDLHVLFDGCRDSSSQVQRQALDSMTALLQRHQSDPRVQQIWLGAVLPLTADQDAAVSEKALGLVRAVLFEPLCTSARDDAARAAKAANALVSVKNAGRKRGDGVRAKAARKAMQDDDDDDDDSDKNNHDDSDDNNDGPAEIEADESVASTTAVRAMKTELAQSPDPNASDSAGASIGSNGNGINPRARAAIWALLDLRDTEVTYHLQRCVALTCARITDPSSAAVVAHLAGAVNSVADSSIERGFWLVAEEFSAHAPHLLRGDVALAAFARAQALVRSLPYTIERPAALAQRRASLGGTQLASPFAAARAASAALSARAAGGTGAVLPVQLPTRDDVYDHYARVLRTLANVASAFVCVGRPRPQGLESAMRRAFPTPGLPAANARIGVATEPAVAALNSVFAELTGAIANSQQRELSSSTSIVSASAGAKGKGKVAGVGGAGVTHVTGAQIKTLHALSCAIDQNNHNNSHGSAASASAVVKVPDWEKALSDSAAAVLEAYVVRGDAGTENGVIAQLFALGEVALVSDRFTPSLSMITLIQALLPARLSRAVRVAGLTEAEAASSNAGAGASADQLRQHALGVAVAAVAASGSGVTPTAVRAHAFTTMGKLCLTDSALAKRMVGTFISELESGDAVVRNNILIVLCDLCRTYTSLVDPHISALSRCLRDASVLVRRHTLMVLAQLITEDFVKFKGSLYFRLLATTIDGDAGVRALGRQTVAAVVRQKGAQRYYRHFVETVFFLNGCTAHHKYNQFTATDDSAIADADDAALTQERLSAASAAGGRGAAAAALALAEQTAATARARADDQRFAVSGPALAPARMEVYSFLLSQMSPEERFFVTIGLVKEILNACVTGELPLPGVGAILEAAQVHASIAASIGGLLNKRLSLEEKQRKEHEAAHRARNALAAGPMTPQQESAVMDVVRDALTVLCSPEIKISLQRPGSALEEGDDAGEAAVNSKRATLLNAVSNKNSAELIFPIVTELKRLATATGSSLIKPIMVYLRQLAHQFRSNLEEIITDNVLRDELLYDLRKFEEKEAKEAADAAAAAEAGAAGDAEAAEAAEAAARAAEAAARAAAEAEAFAGRNVAAGAGAGDANVAMKRSPHDADHIPAAAPALAAAGANNDNGRIGGHRIKPDPGSSASAATASVASRGARAGVSGVSEDDGVRVRAKRRYEPDASDDHNNAGGNNNAMVTPLKRSTSAVSTAAGAAAANADARSSRRGAAAVAAAADADAETEAEVEDEEEEGAPSTRRVGRSATLTGTNTGNARVKAEPGTGGSAASLARTQSQGAGLAAAARGSSRSGSSRNLRASAEDNNAEESTEDDDITVVNAVTPRRPRVSVKTEPRGKGR